MENRIQPSPPQPPHDRDHVAVYVAGRAAALIRLFGGVVAVIVLVVWLLLHTGMA